MSKHFVILIALRGKTSPANEVIERILSERITDWLRFTRGQYVVWYNGNTEEIYNLLKPLLDPEDSILVVETNLATRKGWAGKPTGDWLAKEFT